MKKQIKKITLILFFCGSCFGASLGFDAPSKIFLPGEIFTNKVIVNYDSSDQFPTGFFLNVQWNGDTINIRTAIWNETDFDFYEHHYFNSYSNVFTNTFLYSLCKPYWQEWLANSNLTLVTLVCAVDGHESCNFEFNYFTNDIPYPTAAFDINAHNIIGDTNIFYDGFDVLPVETRAAAGYTLSARIDESDVSVVYNKTNFVLSLEINRFGNPLPYEKIKAEINYDETVVECKSNIFDVPAFFKKYEFIIEKTNLIYNTSGGILTNTEPTGVIIFTAEMSPTNYAGTLAKIYFKPIDYDETEFEFDEVDTWVKRNDVNLLGLVDEDDDGMNNSIVYVMPAKNMRFVLKFNQNFGTVNSVSEAKLYVTASNDGYFDELNFSFFYDTNNVAFYDNDALNFKISDDLTNNSFTIFYTEDLTNSSPLYNQSANLFVLFDSPVTNEKDKLFYVGEFFWTNLLAGNLSCFFNQEDSSIEYEVRDLLDDEKQFTEFPITLPVLTTNDLSNSFCLITLTPENLTNNVLQPGNLTTLNISYISSCSNSLSGQVTWKYDATKFRPVNFSDNVHTNTLILQNGADTSDVFFINGEFSHTSITSIIGTIHFQAIKSGNVFLEPLFNMSFATNKFGNNTLGSSSTTNDGITGITIVCKEPEEIFLRLSPDENLFAGKFSEFKLWLINPLTSQWTSLRVEIEFDKDELQITNCNWDVEITKKYSQINIVTNFIKEIDEIKLLNNQRVVTTKYFKAVLNLQSETPVSSGLSELIASFTGIPVSDEINYDFCFNSSNNFYDLTFIKNYNKNLLGSDDVLNQEEWLVAQSGVKIWIESERTTRPIIQSVKNMHVFVDNPNGIQFNHVTLAWTYDANNFEILSADAASQFNGTVWVNNHDDGEGHLCADLYLDSLSSNREMKVLDFYILPKLTDVLEMEIDSVEISYTNEIEAGVWRGDINLLETLDDTIFDTCQEWKRGPELTQHPLLYLEDIYDLASDETVLELNGSETGLEVYKEDVNYKWWAVGNTNIIINFNNKSMTAKIMAKSNWTGREIFWVYCEDLNNKLISKDSIQIDVNDPRYNWSEFSIYTTREQYYTITDYLFSDIKFELKNPPERFDIYCYVIENENITNQVPLNLNGNKGNIIWQTPSIPGTYYGYITATNCNDTTETAFATFKVDVIDGYYNVEADGDRFMVLHNKIPITLQVPTRIVINSGTDNDTLKIKVWKNKQRGDGIVKFDQIIANHGFKKIFLPGSVNLIETDGPIGSLLVKKGTVGQINVKKGGIKNVKIVTGWDNYYQSFFDVGLVSGIDAYGSIGTVKVVGGNIGDDYYPAAILSRHGSIGNVITKMKKRIYYDGIPVLDNKYIEVAGDNGANIYANIYAPNGSIDSVIAIGGQIGTEIFDAATKIYSSRDINKIIAKSKKGDEEILGGSILSDIYAKNNIYFIKSLGGNIAGSLDVMDTDGELDDYELIINPVIIKAGDINKIFSIGKKYRFRDGYSKDDVWNELHGGNISACIKSGNFLKMIKSKAGTMCVNVETKNEIVAMKAKSVNFKEYWDDVKQKFGGNLIYSTIMPNVKYMSDKSSDYLSFIGLMKFSGIVKESWIGTRGPYDPKKFKIYNIQDSEIWVNGKKVN